MNPTDYLQFVLALLFVLGLIGLAAMLARRFGLAPTVRPDRGPRRLAVVESIALDGKRRLLLLRRDGVEHLVILGPSSGCRCRTRHPRRLSRRPPLARTTHVRLNGRSAGCRHTSCFRRGCGRGHRERHAGGGAERYPRSRSGGGGGDATGRIVQLLALLTVLSLAPSILVMVTSFTRIIVVLSFLRTALGIQQTPPNQVLISLALFLTFFVMTPTLERSWDDGIRPLIEGSIDEMQAFERAAAPVRAFMAGARARAGRGAVRGSRQPEARRGCRRAPAAEAPLRVLIPAFMISELRRAFEIGFLVFVPFLIIDMVVASVLMSMGMMMLPPVTVALPFKMIFFVLVDGWYLIVGSLVRSFG